MNGHIVGLLEDIERDADAVRQFAFYYLEQDAIPPRDRIHAMLVNVDVIEKALRELRMEAE